MGLDWVAFKGPFQHKLLFDPMIQILLWLKYLWFAFGKKSVTLSAKSPADTVSNASGDLSLQLVEIGYSQHDLFLFSSLHSSSFIHEISVYS